MKEFYRAHELINAQYGGKRIMDTEGLVNRTRWNTMYIQCKIDTIKIAPPFSKNPPSPRGNLSGS
jgi:hypothetical protein